MSTSEIPWFFSHIFPWPFVLTGGGLAYDAIRELIRAHQSHHWPTTEGALVTSSVIKREADEESAASYSADIEYEYIVHGVTKTGSKIALAGRYDGRKAKAEAIVQHYAQGSHVRVYYSPHNPDVAVLEPGVCWSHCSSLLVGLLFLIAGVTMLWAFGWWDWLVPMVQFPNGT